MISMMTLLMLVSCLTFHQVLFNEFSYDDLPAVVNNDLDIKTMFTSKDFWGGELTSPKSHKSYRPLTSMIFLLLQKHSFSIHFFNFILHSANTALVFLIAERKLFKNDSKLAFISALIFNLHPVHVEPVASAVGSADLLYSFTVLWALHKNLHDPILASFCVLFKEQGIVFMAMVKMISLKTFFVTSAVFLLRMSLIGFQAPDFQTEDNPHAKIPDFPSRILNRLYLYWLNFRMILSPDRLCFDWALKCVPIIDFNDEQILPIAISGLILFGLFWRCFKEKMISTVVLWTILPFFPCSNIVFNVGFVLAERNLYLVIFGYSILISVGFQRIPPRLTAAKNVLLTVTLTAFALKSYDRTWDWKNEKSLYLSGLEVCPNNAKIHYNVAKLLGEEGQVQSAISFYRTALRLHPDYEGALNNLANIYRQNGDFSKAERLLLKAVRINEEFSTAWMNLGVVQAELGRFTRAEKSYLKAKRLRESYPDADFNLGNLYLKSGSKTAALESFISAAESDSSHKSAWINAVMLSDELGKTSLAVDLAEKAITLNPDLTPELNFHLGNIFGKMNDFAKAEKHYEMARDYGTKSDDGSGNGGLYYGNLGVLYHRWKKYDLAKENYIRALEIDSDNENVFKNLKIVEGLLQKL